MKRKASQITPGDEENDSTVDSTEARSLIEFCKTLPPKPNDMVRFFARKGQKNYYTVHDEDADLIADDFYHSRTVIKTYNVGVRTTNGTSKMQKNDVIRYLHISENVLTNVVRYLVVDRRFRVEIYQSENRQWKLARKGSPGNLQELEDLIFSEEELDKSPVLIAIKIGYEKGQRIVGAAYCDTILRKIGVSEFIDNEQLSNLESLLFQVGASECFVPPLDEKDLDSKKLHELLSGDRKSVTVTVRKKQDFDARNIEQDLNRLLGDRKFEATNLLDMKFAMSATACLIAGLDLMSKEENFGAFGIIRYDNLSYMRLDNAAVQALNLLPTQRDPNQQHSLYGLLNRCKTAIGSRLLLQWMKQPLLDVDAINARLDIVECLITDWNMTKQIGGTLRKVPDLERLCKKLQRKKVSLEDIVNLYQFALKLPEIIGALQDNALDPERQRLLEERFLSDLKGRHEDLEGYRKMVEGTIDADSISEGQYTVNPAFDDELKALYEQKKVVKNKIEKHEEKVKLQLDSPAGFRCEHDSKLGGYVFRITKKDEKILSTPANKKSFSILSSTKAGTKFTDPTLSQYSEEFERIAKEYESKSAVVVDKIIGVAQTYLPVFESLHKVISELDVFQSLADLAHNAADVYVRPLLRPLGEGNIILRDCRHPVLEAQPDMQFVANDIELTRDQSQFVIITGPNMGGKSTYIRMAGVVVLMAQIGSFVPCSSAEIALCDAILARVGAGDSQLRGVSTFMAEMLETASILKTAKPQSLVIIDELGRGTSTYDGFGLAWAISEYICKRLGSFCLFATHFHELTQLQDEIPYVANKHVSAVPDNERGIVLQYKVEPGPSDQSFGIHVARIAHFPAEVIEMAEQKARELENFEARSLNLRGNETSSAAQQEQEEGERIIDAYLREFSSKDIGSLNPQQLKEYLSDLRRRLESETNPYVQSAIARAT